MRTHFTASARAVWVAHLKCSLQKGSLCFWLPRSRQQPPPTFHDTGKQEGRGNGKKTVIVNAGDVAKVTSQPQISCLR